MSKPIYLYFTQDHRRLERLFDKATEKSNEIQEEYYHQFRVGLLKHIKMEEKILFLAAQKANGNLPLPLAAKLRLDHGALTSLMVVPPSAEVIKVIKHVIELHDQLEEEAGGMYEACEQLTEHEKENILQQLHQTTEVPVHPYNTAAYALEAAKRALTRAGFDFDTIAAS